VNGCSKTEYREENLDDQIEIFFLESELESDECGEPDRNIWCIDRRSPVKVKTRERAGSWMGWYQVRPTEQRLGVRSE